MGALAALRVGLEAPHAVRGALRALEEGRGPVAAAKAFAAATTSQTDDAAAAWLVDTVRTGVRLCDTAIAAVAGVVEILERSRPVIRKTADGAQATAVVVAAVATRLADPAIPATVDRAVGWAIDGGWKLIGLRATLRTWLDA